MDPAASTSCFWRRAPSFAGLGVATGQHDGSRTTARRELLHREVGTLGAQQHDGDVRRFRQRGDVGVTRQVTNAIGLGVHRQDATGKSVLLQVSHRAAGGFAGVRRGADDRDAARLKETRNGVGGGKDGCVHGVSLLPCGFGQKRFHRRAVLAAGVANALRLTALREHVVRGQLEALVEDGLGQRDGGAGGLAQLRGPGLGVGQQRVARWSCGPRCPAPALRPP